MRSVIIRLMAVLFSVFLFLTTGEAALRIIYRDGGRTTSGGPGGRSFEYLTIGNERRGRRDTGPRRNVPRIMVIGDSITYGQGVRDWRHTWPEVLARRLEDESRPHDMAVFALPGQGIVEHVKTFEREGPHVQPDILFYQWHVNDLETDDKRPDFSRGWQRWWGHQALRRFSYLYFFLDSRAASLLPPPHPTYNDYLLATFATTTPQWAEFERYFHSFAMRARSIAAKRIVLLYPQVPFQGVYPLQPINDRMHALANPHTLTIPLTSTRDPESASPRLQSGDYYFEPGTLKLMLVLDGPAAASSHRDDAATLHLVDAASNTRIAATPVPSSSVEDNGPITVQIDLPGRRGRWIRYVIEVAPSQRWTRATLRTGVDYGLQIVDLRDAFVGIDSHVSIFDAHPNAAAHRIIAEHAYKALQKQ